MKVETATNAKMHFGKILSESMLEPVIIEKSGRHVAVVISYEQYQHLQALEDQYWIAKAAAAKEEGFIGQEESEQILQKLLHAEG